MTARVIAHVDLDAMRHNIGCIRSRLSPTTSLLAMVKSQAYGHGLASCAQALEGDVDAFGVACLEEAHQIKSSGCTTPIVVMSGFLDEREYQHFATHGFIPVIHTEKQLAVLREATALPHCWWKLDTGMHRLGFSDESFFALYEECCAQGLMQQTHVLMTHLADADAPEGVSFYEKQIKRFQAAVSHLSHPMSLLNSAGIFVCQEAAADWVRPGIALYGISPFSDHRGIDLGLKPVMTLRSRVLAVHDIAVGEGVGYGHAWHASQPSRIAVVAAGYADGIPRHAPNGWPVLVGGVRCPLVGHVSMDMLTIDVTAIPSVSVGDTVTLWGDGLPIEEVAQLAGTIPYELVTRLTRRVHYVYEGVE